MFKKLGEFHSRMELGLLAKKESLNTPLLDKFRKTNEQLQALTDEEVKNEYKELQNLVSNSANMRDESGEIAELHKMVDNRNESVANSADRQKASKYTTEGFKLLNNYQEELKRRNLSLPTMEDLGL